MVLEPSRSFLVGVARRPVVEAPSWFGQVPDVSGGSRDDCLAHDGKILPIQKV